MTVSPSKQGWTPGPWLIDALPSGNAFGPAAGRAYGVSAKNNGGYRVPVVVWRGLAKPASAEGQANAHLIAAAPDLYEALEAVLNTSGARNTGYNAIKYSEAVALAENALIKARANPSTDQGEG